MASGVRSAQVQSTCALVSFGVEGTAGGALADHTEMRNLCTESLRVVQGGRALPAPSPCSEPG